MRTVRPIGNKLLVKRDATKDVTPGGIIIPENAKEKLHLGTVIAVGPGKVLDSGRLVEPTVKRGDRVMFGKYSGTEFTLDDERDLLVLNEDDVFGVVEPS